MSTFRSRWADWQPPETPSQRTDKTDKSPSVSFVSSLPGHIREKTEAPPNDPADGENGSILPQITGDDPFVSFVSSLDSPFSASDSEETSEISTITPVPRTDGEEEASPLPSETSPETPSQRTDKTDKRVSAPHLIAAVEVPPGCPGEWVQGVAKLLVMPRPRAWRADGWSLLLDDARDFLRRHGAEAARLGWDVLDVYGIHPKKPLARFDSMGLVPLLDGRAVVELGEESAVIEDHKGQRMTFRKHPAPAERILIWESTT